MSRLVIGMVAIVMMAAAIRAADDDSAAKGGPPIDVRGQLEASEIDAGRTVAFSLTLTNTSQATLGGVRIAHVGGADVTLRSATWCKDVSWQGLRACTVASALAPKQSVTVYGTLDTVDVAKANVSAIVDWMETLPPKSPATTGATLSSTATFPIGTLNVESAGLRRAGYFMAWLTSLAIPIVGGLFALGWKLTEQSRASKRADRDDTLHQLERDRDEKSAAWRLMLPVSHDFAIKYYAQLNEAARSLVYGVEAVLKQTDQTAPADKTAALNAAFYAWVMLHARREALVKEGAFYFKNHTGELLVVALYRAYSFSFVSQSDLQARPAPTEQREAVRRLLVRVATDTDVDETIDRFLKRVADDIRYGGDLKALWHWFSLRLSQPQPAHVADAMAYLLAFSDVLFFEMNRPYSPWFDEAPATLNMPHERIESARKAVKLLSKWDSQILPVKDKLEDYLKEAKKGTTAKPAIR